MRNQNENDDLPFNQLPAERPPMPLDGPIGPPEMGEGQITAGSLVASGKTLVQTRLQYQTAVSVQKPRNLIEVCRRVEREAEIAGDSLYYSMTFKGKNKDTLVEGPGIEMAMMVLRNFGNCAMITEVREEDDAFYFTPVFIDLETGVNISRTKRLSKNRTVFGKFDEERKMEIRYEIGQSLAIRNVVLRSVPNWIVDKAMEVARNSAIAKIEKMGIVPAAAAVMKFFEQNGITPDRVQRKIGKVQKSWDAADIAILYGAMRSMKEGAESADDLFPIETATASDTPSLGETSMPEKESKPKGKA